MVTNLGLSIEANALPDDDLREHRRLYNEWKSAYPNSDPIVQGLLLQAVLALTEIRRLERVRATVRTEKVRTALLFWEQGNEDHVETYLQQFNIHPPSALVGLLRSAAGCRWALAFLGRLQKLLDEDGTWYGVDMIGAIQIQGLSACVNELYLSEDAYMTWVWCLAAQPNPKQREIDRILDPGVIPKSFQDRDAHLWPLDPVESRARLQAMLDREIPRIREREATLRVEYEDPSRAEARTMALATMSKEEIQLLRAQRTHEQSYLQASTALMKFQKKTAGERVKRRAADIEPGMLRMPPQPDASAPSDRVVREDREGVVEARGGSQSPPPQPSPTRGEGVTSSAEGVDSSAEGLTSSAEGVDSSAEGLNSSGEGLIIRGEGAISIDSA